MKMRLRLKTFFAVALTTAALLLVPLVAMQFSSEMAWTGADFAAAAVLVFVTGMALVLAGRRRRAGRQRWAVSAAIVFVALAVWAELAVGLFH